MCGAEPSGLFFEDFLIDQKWVTGSHTVTASEIAEFAELTGDNNPLHIDPNAARAAGFRDVIAHGFLIQSLTMGLIADTGIMRGTTIALVGADLRFASPALAGTEIHAIVRVSEKRVTSGGKHGILHREITTVDEHGTVLVEGQTVNLMRLKPQ